MAAPTESATDKTVGFALLLGTIAVFGALGMAVGAPDEIAAWAFAAAMTFAGLAVAAIHLYAD